MVLLSRVGSILGLSASNKRARWWPVGLLAVPLAIWLASTSIVSPAQNEIQAEEVADHIADTATSEKGADDATGKSVDDDRIAQLIEQLGDDTYGRREAAQGDLTRIGRPALEAARGHADAEVAFRAKRCLAEICPEKSLIAALGGDDDSTWTAAVSELATLGEPAVEDLAGGWGNEWYFGYKHAHSDLSLEDFRSRDRWWDCSRYALEFFKKHEVPVWEMTCHDDLTPSADDYCLCRPGLIYVIYVKNGGTAKLDLSDAKGTFEVQWYDPRHGGSLVTGPVRAVQGGSIRSLGAPPKDTSEDWAVLVRRTE